MYKYLIIILLLLSCNSKKSNRLIIREVNSKTDTIIGKQVKTFDFIVNNLGNSKVEVIKIVPSCGCTSVVENGLKVIGPGDSIHLKFQYVPENSDSGDVKKSIVIMTDSKPSISYAVFRVYVKK